MRKIDRTMGEALSMFGSSSVTRRGFLGMGLAGLAAGSFGPGAAAGPLTPPAQAGGSGRAPGREERVLLKGGCVLSLDPQVGDFDAADVLIEGSRIVEVQPNLSADAEVMPSEFFTQVRTVFGLQRMLALERQRTTGTAAPRLLTVRDVVEFGTIQGARDNHLDRKIGTLTPGKDADIVLLRMHAINVMPVNNAYGAVVVGDTSTVFIAGRARKRGGRLVDVDLDAVRRRVEASRDDIVSKAGWPPTRLGRDLPGH